LDQLVKVKEFKGKVGELGGVYCNYDSLEDFKSKLTQHLNSHFLNLLGKQSKHPEVKEQSKKLEQIALRESVTMVLNSRLKESLCLFLNQPIVWIEPIVSKTNDISKNADDNYSNKVDLDELIKFPQSVVIKAPPQFGLTCLSHHLVAEAWKKESLWIYLDSEKVRRDQIEKSINKESKFLSVEGRKIDCIILDSWNASAHGAKKLLKNLCNKYREIPIVVMENIGDAQFMEEDQDIVISREFKHYHLLALPRRQIRQVVSTYNDEKYIGEDDVVLEKLIKDIDALNIHRTPHNCLTLLKVSEKHFDESPVNRTKMIEMLLFVLFDLGELPTYKVKPDLKDCEYVLGRFCENLLRNNQLQFSRESFLENLEEFCADKLLHLEVSSVFDILFANNIIVGAGKEFSFRSTYWIYYFSAKRMYSSDEFKHYVLQERAYPEIIEFYTGIDRSRADVLEILIKDIHETSNLVEEKTGLPAELNPLKFAKWNPTKQNLDQMHEELAEDVITSKLPESVKDKYADKDYNQLRPYDQSVSRILQDYSIVSLKHKIKACSRALRNSDYVDPDIKRQLLKEITRGWLHISKILFALAPVLAEDGRASFSGQGFYLNESFKGSTEEKFEMILQANPINVIKIFNDDLHSNKIGPLLYDALESEEDELIKHLLVLFLIIERPADWKKHVLSYITSIDKNSFYLFNAVTQLRSVYKYSFAADNELNEISYLLKLGVGRHEFDEDMSNLATVKKVSNKVLPKREVRPE
jgi:hypothetical protein|tara:strand:+ start:2707 stop:4968 length:2262 start_codon:yes stop_codon:yes gene_type:complete